MAGSGFLWAARRLEKALEHTASSITFHIEEICKAQLKHLNRLLKRLSRFGDGVYIAVNEKMRSLVDIDPSVFNLVFEA